MQPFLEVKKAVEEKYGINEQDSLWRYMTTFYGYGNLMAPIWLIGMEEAGSQLELRVRIWEKQRTAKSGLLDAYEFHLDPDWDDDNVLHSHRVIFDSENLRQQPTWYGLGMLLYFLENSDGVVSPTRQDLNFFQAHKLGRRENSACLMELLPLPNRNIGTFATNQVHDQG